MIVIRHLTTHSTGAEIARLLPFIGALNVWALPQKYKRVSMRSVEVILALQESVWELGLHAEGVE
jgi:hypothetical protein